MQNIIHELWKIGIAIILAVGAVGIIVALLQYKLSKYWGSS